MAVDYNKLYNEYQLENLESQINITFDDKDLLTKAFVHSSYCSENNNNYQRLEFLGDSVLQIIVSDYIYRHMTDQREGEMSKLRARLVSELSLSSQIKKYNFDKYLILGKSVVNEFSSIPNSFLCDIFESLTAAIFLDQGYLKTEEFIKKYLIDDIEEILSNDSTVDYKTKMQELLQINGTIKIEYNSKKKDDHFISILLIEGVKISEGIGKSKKIAEQNAAKIAYEKKVK